MSLRSTPRSEPPAHRRVLQRGARGAGGRGPVCEEEQARDAHEGWVGAHVVGVRERVHGAPAATLELSGLALAPHARMQHHLAHRHAREEAPELPRRARLRERAVGRRGGGAAGLRGTSLAGAARERAAKEWARGSSDERYTPSPNTSPVRIRCRSPLPPPPPPPPCQPCPPPPPCQARQTRQATGARGAEGDLKERRPQRRMQWKFSSAEPWYASTAPNARRAAPHLWGKGTRRVQLVRREGRDVSTLYGREGGGRRTRGRTRGAARAPAREGGSECTVHG